MRKRTIGALAKEVESDVGKKELVATLRFSFQGPVTEKQLASAILRAVATREFGLVGQCTVVTVQDPIAVVMGP